MPWEFGLSIECASKKAAESMSAYFQGNNPLSSDDKIFDLHIYTYGIGKAPIHCWWCVVSVKDGQTNDFFNSSDCPQTATDLVLQLYQRLAKAPRLFRYALAGTETSEFRGYDEFVKMEQDEIALFPGLVMSEALYWRLGTPPDFIAFCPGYIWKPYSTMNEIDC
ncbi:MAG: hypothetical protein F6J87_15665 [Spirulina sp. SIO3F2]|nr:hypothetical protein [Spirulina sp. SIO3F2]